MFDKAHRFRRRTVHRRGFTLVELLVVVSITAMLVAMLSPSLKSARDQAKRVVCGSRLKQWGLAFSCYAAENRDMWPHCDGLDRGPDDRDEPDISKEDLADWHGWVDLLPPTLRLKRWRDYPRYQRPNQETFYQCPFARPTSPLELYSYRPLRDGYFSYAMNSCLELDTNAWPPPDNVGWPMPSFLDTTKIVASARVILLFEQLLDPRKGFDEQLPYRAAGKHCGSYPKAFSARHQRGRSGLGGNLLYADGHVDWQRSVWKAHWALDQEVPPRDDPEWYPYPARAARLTKK